MRLSKRFPSRMSPYWEEIREIINWAKANRTDALYVCWAAQAALYVLRGIQKSILADKAFGVFEQAVMTPSSPLVRGMGSHFPVPVSRHTAVAESRSPQRDCRHSFNPRKREPALLRTTRIGLSASSTTSNMTMTRCGSSMNVIGRRENPSLHHAVRSQDGLGNPTRRSSFVTGSIGWVREKASPIQHSVGFFRTSATGARDAQGCCCKCLADHTSLRRSFAA